MSNEEISTCTKINLPFDAIYDRASMIAIEPSRRQDYVALLGSMLRPGGSILLVTIEKRTVAEEGAKLSGPPFSIDEEQVRQLYEGHEWVESIALLEEKNEIATDADKERWEARGVSEAYELVFLIRKKEND
jgi:thiopurine S-methyltransferase